MVSCTFIQSATKIYRAAYHQRMAEAWSGYRTVAVFNHLHTICSAHARSECIWGTINRRRLLFMTLQSDTLSKPLLPLLRSERCKLSVRDVRGSLQHSLMCEDSFRRSLWQLIEERFTVDGDHEAEEVYLVQPSKLKSPSVVWVAA